MKDNPSRRNFFKTSGIVAAGVLLFSVGATKYCMADTVAEYELTNGTPDLRTFGNKHITIKGNVYDKTGTNTVHGAIVEIWHLSPGLKEYKHRAKVITNSKGEYKFITDLPDRDPGMMPRVYFSISHESSSYTTELLINDNGAHITGKHWEKNNQLGQKLFPKKEMLANHSIITFDITI
jgi:protocatechuate 3,4-dioxygenase beta subunit